MSDIDVDAVLDEIAFAKQEMEPGETTITRLLDQYEDDKVLVTFFVTTTLKSAP